MKRSLIRILALAGALFLSLAAGAQVPSGKHTTLLVPYAAGGPADVLARLVATPLSQAIEQTLVVENLGGAGGVLGAQKVLSEPADGKFLLQASPNEMILAPAINSAAKLRAEDFTLLQPLVRGVLVLLVRKDLPVRNADELIALARQRADKPMSYGSVGVGSINHLIMEQVQRETATRFLHVPYKGSTPMLQDLGGGQIDVAITVHGGASAGLVEKGLMKIIGQFGQQRSALLPQVPAVKEGAALHHLSYTTWNGVMVRKDTPPTVASRLNHALVKVMQSPQLSEALSAQYLEPMPPMSFEEAAKFFRSEIESNRKLLAAIDLKLQ